jgi:RNA polymerase sigma factor (TIGR02999 family)
MASERRHIDQTSASGPESADLDHLVRILYRDLRRIAHARLARRQNGATLSTTALVHEAYLKLADHRDAGWQDREHFLAVASLAMRHILTDRAKARFAAKRGGTRRRVTFDGDAIAGDAQPEALLQIDDALNKLSQIDARLAHVVVLRFFGGMTHEEIAAHFGVTARTIEREWAKARVLLRELLAT